MLTTLCLATLIMWAAGRAACNFHVPGESLTPRAVSFEDRTRLPKDVAFELAQQWSSGEFELAKKLASGEVLSLIQKDEAKCGACDERRAAADEIFSVATVLRANTGDTIVKVRTVGGPSGEVTRIFGVERGKREWRAARMYDSAEEAKLKPIPGQEEEAEEDLEAEGEKSEASDDSDKAEDGDTATGDSEDVEKDSSQDPPAGAARTTASDPKDLGSTDPETTDTEAALDDDAESEAD